MLEAKQTKEESKKKILVETVSTRGRVFKGFVTKKFEKRAVIEFERTVYVPKYERFAKKKTRLHAYIPESIKIDIGDYVKVRECRPLSKIVNFVVIENLRRKDDQGEIK